MNKITISISALFLSLGLLSGCGEKKEEAPKAEAPAAEQKPAEQAAAPVAAPVTSSNPMTAMTDAANSAATAMGDAAKSAGDAASKAADSATQAVGDAAKATGDAATQAVSDAAKATGDVAAKAADETAKAATDATAAVANAGVAVDGEKVYKGLCFSCHDMGIAGAPKLGDKAAWAPRIATGDALYASALNGKNAMPAKGGNPALSEAEVKASVDWMVAQSK